MDRNTFTKLLKLHGDRIYSYVLYFLGEREEAEDATQEVFLRLWQRCPATDQSGAAAWMMKVAHNLCIDAVRRRGRERKRIRAIPAHSLANLPARASSQTDPEQCLQLDERQRLLLSALATLPATTQSVLLMHYFQGLKCREIAHILDVGESTIKVRIHRGRRALRQVLTPTGDDVSSGKREAV